jgi:hypothetical protein
MEKAGRARLQGPQERDSKVADWRNIPIALFDPDGCRTILGERYRLLSTVIVVAP